MYFYIEVCNFRLHEGEKISHLIMISNILFIKSSHILEMIYNTVSVIYI